MSEATIVEKLQFGAATLESRTGLGENDSALVPDWDEHYQIDEGTIEDLAVCVEEDLPILLVGPTGCGKTAAVRALAALLNQPLQRINLHGDVRSSTFLGEKVLRVDPKSGQTITEWKDGVVPDAARRGHWLLLDEFDACPPSLAFTVQALLENGHVLTLADNHGEVIRPDPRFRIFATANTTGRGDDAGIYNGTAVLNEATLDRFQTFEFGYPDRDKEIEILVEKTGIKASVAGGFVDCARLVRQGFDKSETASTFSTRRLLAWALLARKFVGDSKDESARKRADAHAFKIAVRGKLGKDDRAYVAGIVQRTIGIDVSK